MSCDPEVARELTYRFLGLEANSPDEILNEIKDCMGEVANIVGGNVKTLLPRGVDHSVPVFAGTTPPERDAIIAVAFNCSADPLCISLIKCLTRVTTRPLLIARGNPLLFRVAAHEQLLQRRLGDIQHQVHGRALSRQL